MHRLFAHCNDVFISVTDIDMFAAGVHRGTVQRLVLFPELRWHLQNLHCNDVLLSYKAVPIKGIGLDHMIGFGVR